MYEEQEETMFPKQLQGGEEEAVEGVAAAPRQPITWQQRRTRGKRR
eukprot:COSAG01_NODE_2173_length_8229_cov_287.185855_3_plen_46_part_00